MTVAGFCKTDPSYEVRRVFASSAARAEGAAESRGE